MLEISLWMKEHWFVFCLICALMHIIQYALFEVHIHMNRKEDRAKAARATWECELLRLEANLKRELTDSYSQKLGEGGHGKALADIDAVWTLRFNERVNAWKRDNPRP